MSTQDCPCHARRPSHSREIDALSRVEGQVRGVRRMIEEERYCVDILVQTRAIHAALRQVERRILQAHLETCVSDAFREGTDADQSAKIAEILNLFEKDAGGAAA